MNKYKFNTIILKNLNLCALKRLTITHLTALHMCLSCNQPLKVNNRYAS